MRSRIFTLIVVYVVLFSILVGRLFYLQIVQGEAYDEQATIKNEKQKTIKKQRLTTYPGLKIWRNFFTHISLSIVFSQHG